MKKGILLPLAVIIILVMVGCGEGVTAQTPTTVSAATPEAAAEEKSQPAETASPKPAPNELTFGSTFEFDSMEITFGSTVEWSVIDNEWSEYHGEDVFSIPITVKNIGDETNSLSFIQYKQFGSKGLSLSNISHYVDNGIDEAGQMRPGATQNAVMAFLYDGDGDYYVEFGIFSKEHEVKFTIIK
ncbi:MAG: hypothetical protein FWH16_02905 [Oscillospiraceae bacterium]|nr:hypothetical protein [Oscillospiraceae bacterium]